MASGEHDLSYLPKHMTFSKSNVPLIGAFVDYVDTNLHYLIRQSFARAEKLNAKSSRSTLSASFLALVCFSLGFACNVKFEVATYNDEQLPNDLHFVLLSKEDNLYIDDIDVSQVVWCIEASDLLVLGMSCLLVLNSSNVPSPLSEYLFLPWMGVALRGLFLRQVPTAGALVYTMIMITGSVSPLFMTAFSLLFLIEARLWLEVARVVCQRWERRHDIAATLNTPYEIETLWSNEDVQSVEVQNYVY